jgi:glyoxylase-like metal-dependent hydrolase (beta-lactamase superfamily II)
MHLPNLSRRHLLGALAGSAAFTGLGAPRLALAQTAETTVPRPVIYDRPVGDARLTVMLDGYFPLGLDMITNMDPAQVKTKLAAAYHDTEGSYSLAISSHLIRSGDQITLVDGGTGGAFGPTAGRLLAALEAAGVAPEDVTRIALTHMHPDHIGGLLTGATATFANATLHVAAPELAFWTDEATGAAAPADVQSFFTLSRALKAAYGDRLATFDGETDLGAGLSTLPLPGHTVGHTGYRLSSGNDQLLILGDSAFFAALHFQHPDVGIVFDSDRAMAAETRKKLFAMAASDRLAVCATHLAFPAVGHVEVKDDAYAWVPEEWRDL